LIEFGKYPTTKIKVGRGWLSSRSSFRLLKIKRGRTKTLPRNASQAADPCPATVEWRPVAAFDSILERQGPARHSIAAYVTN